MMRLTSYFKGKKGLRQGDPISPYFSILLMESFSFIWRNLFITGSLCFILIAKL